MSEANKSSPVRIVKEQTKTTSGTQVQEKMIEAARVFSDILRPTYGPRDSTRCSTKLMVAEP